MPIGLGAKRDDRRRRALMDDRQDSTEPTTKASGATSEHSEEALTGRRRKRRYTASARRKSQLTIVDMIPRRWWALLLVWLGLGAVATLMGSWVWAVREEAPAIDWVSKGVPPWGEVAARAYQWTLSLVLILAAFVSTQIYLIRRHRADDYRGHYRIWTWAAGGFILASFDATVGLHRRVLFEVMGQVSRQPSEAGLWLLDWVLLPLGILAATRLVWEMWDSRAKWGVIAATLGIGSAGIVPWGMGMTETEAIACIQLVLLGTSCCMLASLITYGRYTLLDAHGLIVTKVKVREKGQVKGWFGRGGIKSDLKRTDEASVTQDTTDETSDEEDRPTLKPAAVKGGKGQKRKSSSESVPTLQPKGQGTADVDGKVDEKVGDNQDDEVHEMIHSLSKAKRKKLSKKQRRQQRRAA